MKKGNIVCTCGHDRAVVCRRRCCWSSMVVEAVVIGVIDYAGVGSATVAHIQSPQEHSGEQLIHRHYY